MADYVVVLALGALSWVFRVFFVLVPADRLPRRASEALEFLGPAVLAALVAVGLTSLVSGADLAGVVPVLGATALLVWVAHRFRSLTVTVLVALAAIVTVDLVLR